MSSKEIALALEKGLYMPSTPLNILISCAHALNFPSQSAREIWLIDQKRNVQSPYFEALQEWSSSPFSNVEILFEPEPGIKKWNQRKDVFREIECKLSRFQPDFVAVGSDRRIEFQYVMHVLNECSHRVLGVYLDDGLYSYAGRTQTWWKDPINRLLKTLFYGSWWEEPKTVGASKLINATWLFKPEFMVSALANKKSCLIEPEWFRSPQILQLSHLIANKLGFDLSRLADIDMVVLVPHPNNIEKIPGYKKRIVNLVGRCALQGKTLAIKYHPRSQGQDNLNLMKAGASEILPSSMAFEFMLPLFKEHISIIGDVGTSLFTSKWLRPDSTPRAFLDRNDDFQKQFVELSEMMGVTVVNDSELI